MDDLKELVDLPDPSVQPLVHPLDLPAARGSFRTGWVIGVLTSPAVGIALGAAVWSPTSNYLLAAVAGLSLIVIGLFASRVNLDAAWEFIPRKRQDRRRRLPATWDLAEGIVIGASVAVTVALVASRLAEPDIEGGIRQFIVGAGVATVLLVVVDLLASLLLDRSPAARRPWLVVPILVSVVVGAAVAIAQFGGSTDIALTSTVLLGAVGMTIVGIVVLSWQALAARRPPRTPDAL